MTDSAVMRPVFGFSDGIFSIDIEKRAESDSTSIRCMLRVTVGSAQISSLVRSGPIPASDSATATFRLAGNPLAASRAVRRGEAAVGIDRDERLRRLLPVC